MISADNLSKSYGELEAVCNLSFSIEQGEVVGLLGPNGAGKTTTMRMLTTFLPPTSGTALVAGFDICAQAQEVRRNIGYLPETPALYLEMKVREYLQFVARIKGVATSQVRSAVDDVIDRCVLSEVAGKLCGQLSKGFRQRIGLAAAIVHNPKVIILDEPTSGLDPAQIIEIRKLIRDLRQTNTVILSTHILPEVSETCSRVIIVARGQVVAQGTLEELTQGKSLEQRFLEAVAGEGKSELASQVVDQESGEVRHAK